jgi:hypothetical protein
MTKTTPLLLPHSTDHLDSNMRGYSKKSLSPFPPSLADSELDGPWFVPDKEEQPQTYRDFQSLVIAAYELWCEEEWPLIQGLAMIWGLLYSLTCLVGIIRFLAMREG